MKYKQPRQMIKPLVASIASREIRKQKVELFRATKKQLKQIRRISDIIEQRGIPENLVLKKLPGGLGYGVFLHPEAAPIQRGEVIAPYAGEMSLKGKYEEDESLYAFSCLEDVRLRKAEHEALKKSEAYHPARLYELKLDAAKKGNFTRFINHSDRPNVVAEMMEIPANALGVAPAPIEVVYFAKKLIHPGQQLLVCYDEEGDGYWGAMDFDPVPMDPTTFTLSR